MAWPAAEPHASGRLDVGDGHRLYWEECGEPTAPVVLFVHGGPGGGSQKSDRAFFDPRRWRIILFDQRGAGRSRPLGETVANTTQHLVNDMEALRRHLGVESWTLFGGSWGSTLSLAYAQKHPATCASLILRGVFLASQAEVDWFLHGMGRFRPDAWRAFVDHVPKPEQSDLIGAYLRRLIDPDPAIHQPAAAAWCAYEFACSSMNANPALAALLANQDIIVPMARIEALYLSRHAFLAPGELVSGVDKLRSIPCTIVHGRYDLVCPIGLGADVLAQAWPEAELIVVEDAGHSTSDPTLRRALIEAVARHADMRWATHRDR